MDTDNSMGKVWGGAGVGWSGGRQKNGETSVIFKQQQKIKNKFTYSHSFGIHFSEYEFSSFKVVIHV